MTKKFPEQVIWKLAVVATVSEFLYAAFLVRPYLIFFLYQKPLISLADLVRGDRGAEWRLGFTLFGILAAYVLAIRIARDDSAGRGTSLVIASGFVFSLTFFFLHTIGSTDLYLYSSLARLLVHYHANPFVTSPGAFPGDFLVPYVTWKHRLVQGYGPLWYLLSAVPSALAGNSLLAQLLAMKGMIIGFHLANCILVQAIVSKVRPTSTTMGVLLYAWNPFVLFEGPGDGHNDIVMVFFLFLAVLLLIKARKYWVFPALTLSLLIKPLTLPLFALFWFYQIREETTKTRRWKFAVSSVAMTLAVVVLFYAPFWRGRDTFQAFGHYGGMVAHSPVRLGAMAAQKLSIVFPTASGPIETGQRWLQHGEVILSGLLVLCLAWQSRGGVPQLLARSYLSLFLFMFVMPWYQPWYAISMLSLASLTDAPEICMHSILLTASALGGIALMAFGIGDWYVIPMMWFLPAVYSLKILWDYCTRSVSLRETALVSELVCERP